MTRITVLLSIVFLCFPAFASSAPTPDPSPGGHKKVTLTGYTYTVPVVWTGSLVGGRRLSTAVCHVPARWHGKPNWQGRHWCDLSFGWTVASGAAQ